MPGSPTLTPSEPTTSESTTSKSTTAKSTEPDIPFTEPWQAQVFALTVHLNQEGVFTWPEWAEVFGAKLHESDAAQDGSDYYQRWAAALEQILEQKGLASAETVDLTAASWERAAEATPHGQPIVLANDPLI